MQRKSIYTNRITQTQSISPKCTLSLILILVWSATDWHLIWWVYLLNAFSHSTFLSFCIYSWQCAVLMSSFVVRIHIFVLPLRGSSVQSHTAWDKHGINGDLGVPLIWTFLTLWETTTLNIILKETQGPFEQTLVGVNLFNHNIMKWPPRCTSSLV
jgi:hypothetical protein